jgi:putative transposase
MPNSPYSTDLTNSTWELISPLLPGAQHGGRPRTTDVRAVLNAIFYLLRTGCQWRLLATGVSGVGHGLPLLPKLEERGGVDVYSEGISERVRTQAGRTLCPSVVIMDSQSVKTTERGGARGFDGHKRIKGRKRHILVDTLGVPIACRVEPANMSDRRGAERLLGGLGPLFPGIRTIMADAGRESRKLARQLMRQDGWKLVIVKRRQHAFKITG